MSTTAAPNALKELLKASQLVWEDWLVIACYFAAVIGVGIWSSCRNRGSTKGYFLAGRSMHFIPVGASLFASNIGSGHFIGLAGSGASTGIGVAVFEFSATFILLMLGWLFVPVYISAGVFTMPEYLKKRFGGDRIRIYLSILYLLMYIFTKISADLYSGGVFLEQAVGLGIYESCIVLLLLAMLFTVAGGLTAVIWTDFAQTGIMIGGATALAVLSFLEVGKGEGSQSFGSLYETLTHKYFAAQSSANTLSNGTCNIPPEYALNIMRPATLTTDLPWTGVIFGITISSIWYWCADQVIVQRALAAKNMSHARAGTVLAGYLKFLPLWLLVVPGMVSRVLFPDLVGCATAESCMEACGQETGCTNIAYPLLVLKLMPNAARGLMIAVMMSALMSSLTSIFNSGSTIFTMDIWRRIRKGASETELLIVGRVFVLFLVGISVAWIPVLKGFPELFHYIQQVTAFLAPPVTATFCLGVAWKRINEHGAFWGLMVGLVTGLIRFVLEFAVYGQPPACGSGEVDTAPDIIRKVHYLHFGCILFVVSFVVTIVVSLLTKPIDPRKLRRLTYMSRYEKGDRLDIDADDDVPSHLEMFNSEGNNLHSDSGKNGFTSTDTMAASNAQLTNGEAKLEAEPEEALPWYRTALNWICGIEKQDEPELTDEEMAEMEAKNLSIDESRAWNLINNVNALILILLTVFIWAFFA